MTPEDFAAMLEGAGVQRRMRVVWRPASERTCSDGTRVRAGAGWWVFDPIAGLRHGPYPELASAHGFATSAARYRAEKAAAS